MLVMENDAAVALVCIECGGPILSGQAFINRNNIPLHSESGDCGTDEVSAPNMDLR